MSDFARLLLLLVLAGAALTVLGGAAVWFMEEERRLRRAFRKVLGAPPQAMVTARGRGRGVGFCFSRGSMAVAWDCGAWCLVYRVDELVGAELLIDGEVVGRAYRDEQRRAVDHVIPDASQVVLRLVFDDPHHPDFDLELYLAGDAARKGSSTPAQAVQEANRWLARAEAILRRPAPMRRPAAAVAPQPPARRAPATPEFTQDPEPEMEPDDDVDFDDRKAPF